MHTVLKLPNLLTNGMTKYILILSYPTLLFLMHLFMEDIYFSLDEEISA